MVQAVGTCKGSSKNDDCTKSEAMVTWGETIEMMQRQKRLSNDYAEALKEKIRSVASGERRTSSSTDIDI